MRINYIETPSQKIGKKAPAFLGLSRHSRIETIETMRGAFFRGWSQSSIHSPFCLDSAPCHCQLIFLLNGENLFNQVFLNFLLG